jgi:heptosyltransferase-2
MALFPESEARRMDLFHLNKATNPISLDEARRQLFEFDVIVFLRDDEVIRALAMGLKGSLVFSGGDHLTHETLIQKRALRQLVEYSRTKFFSDQPIEWPSAIHAIGLCVGAGFPTNRWPQIYWIELARSLAALDVRLRIIGGPDERLDAELIRRSVGLAKENVIIGGSDFQNFWAAIDETDLVIASDGGTAHLCSLRRPVLSLFTSSPWRRYAPFGKCNRVVTRDLACAPCLQFSPDEVNACVTRECAAWLLPRDVLKAALAPDCESLPKTKTTKFLYLAGVSHLTR